MMEIGIDVLLDCLKDFKPFCLKGKKELFSISTIILFDKETSQTEKETLYIGFASELPSNVAEDQCICLICIANCEIPEGYMKYPDIKLIILDSGATLTAVYNAVNALLSDERQMKRVAEQLFQSILNGFSLQQVCDLGSELLGNPATISDNSLKAIAHSSNMEVDDPLWKEQVKQEAIFPTIPFFYSPGRTSSSRIIT